MPSKRKSSQPIRSKFDRWVRGYGVWVLRHRVLVVIFSLLVTAALGYGASRLAFSSDYRVYFGENNPQLNAYEAVQDIYTKNDNVLFVLEPQDGKVFTPENLAAITKLTEEAWQVPYSLRVDSVTNFQYSRGAADDLVVGDLVPVPTGLSPTELDARREIAVAEPFLRNRLIAPEADVTAVAVTLEFPEEHDQEVLQVIAFSRDLAQRLEAEYPTIDVRLGGTAPMNNAFYEAATRDASTLIPAMYLVLIVFLAVLLRSGLATLGALLVIGFSSAGAMGLTGWAGLPLTTISVTAPTMILTIALADSVHFLVTMLEQMRGGKSRHAAIREALRLNYSPIFLTSLTTSIGFLSMRFSDSPPLQQLGTMVAVGVGLAFVHSTLFLPAYASLVPIRAPRKRVAISGERFERLGSWILERRQKITWGVATAMLVLTGAMFLNQLDDRFTEYFETSIEFRRDTDFMRERLTGIDQFEYSLGTGEANGIAEPAYLAKLEELRAWFLEQKGVVQVASLSTTMKRLNMNMHGDDPEMYSVPQSRELAAQYLLLYEMSLPFGLDLNNQVNLDKSATRFIVTLSGLSAREMRELAVASETWLRQNAPEEMFSYAVSPTLMFAHISDRNIRAMLGGTAVAFLLITVVLIVALRDLRIGLLSLLPNLAPAVMAFGIWGLFVGRVGLAVSIVAAMTMGIVVDDTIHFFSKYLRGRRELGLEAPDAVRYTFKTVGGALFVTSLVLVCGFLVLSLSPFAQNGQMGKLAAVTVAIALVTDFLMLPGLLSAIDARREHRVAEGEVPSVEAISGEVPSTREKQQEAYG